MTRTLEGTSHDELRRRARRRTRIRITTILAFVSAISLAGCGLRGAFHRAVYGCNGLAPAPRPGPDRAIVGVMHSRVLGRDVSYAIAYPRGAARAIVFALPGRGYDRAWLTDLSVAQRLYALKTPVPFAVATVDGGETYWHRRKTGDDAKAMFEREFVPFAERAVAADAKIAEPVHGFPEAIVGDSMGGYGAALIASDDPKRYRAVALASPAIWLGDPGNGMDAFDGANDFAKNDVLHRASLRTMPILIDKASYDPFVDGIEALAKHVPGTTVTVHPGCHDDAFFASVVDEQLHFVAERLAE